MNLPIVTEDFDKIDFNVLQGFLPQKFDTGELESIVSQLNNEQLTIYNEITNYLIDKFNLNIGNDQLIPNQIESTNENGSRMEIEIENLINQNQNQEENGNGSRMEIENEEEILNDLNKMIQDNEDIIPDLSDSESESSSISFDDHIYPLYFINGAGGIGKTFLYNSIILFCEKYNIQYLCFAHTGIAAGLLKNGTTLHSGFGIPLNLTGNATSSIAKDSPEEHKIKNCKVIIIDEISMVPKR